MLCDYNFTIEMHKKKIASYDKKYPKSGVNDNMKKFKGLLNMQTK